MATEIRKCKMPDIIYIYLSRVGSRVGVATMLPDSAQFLSRNRVRQST